MKVKERFDTLVLSWCDRIQEAVAGLIGKPFILAEPEFRHAGKRELFAGDNGTAILTHVGLEGEAQGNGCVLVGIEAAIALGGARLMLPDAEMDRLLADRDYSGQVQAAYSELARTICDAAAASLAEQYPNARLACGQQEIVDAATVAMESDQPIPDIPYGLISASMLLDGRPLGPLRLVLPAIPLGLEQTDAAAAASDDEALAAPVAPVDSQTPAVSAQQAKPEASRRQELVDRLLHSGMARICEEMSVLLSGVLEITPEENATVAKAAFLDQVGGRQVMTRMQIRGERQGEAYVFVEHATAIYLGGALIMLPETELEETVANGELQGDVREAYEEVSDIVVSVYSALFTEQEPGGFGLAQKSVQLVDPARIDPDANGVFPDQAYCLAAGRIRYNGRDLGRLQLLIPEEALVVEDAPLPAADGGIAAPNPNAASAGKPAAAGPAWPQPAERPDVVICTDDDAEAGRIADILAAMGYLCRVLHFKDQVHGVIHPGVRIVFLVMREASELGFGMAIKISSAGLSAPLVAAAPNWTRTLVLKAVKYGARDILVTPASLEDVREKVEVNLATSAA